MSLDIPILTHSSHKRSRKQLSHVVLATVLSHLHCQSLTKLSTKKEGREAIRKQLKYIEKNLVNIEKLILEGATLDSLNKRQRNLLEVVKKVYEQQHQMWEKETQSVPQRIVSITQPHIRPIVRGKAGKPTDFGAKLSVSYVDNYIFLDRISW